MLKDNSFQLQYEVDCQRIYRLLQPDFTAFPKNVDEDEIVCELVELYENIYCVGILACCRHQDYAPKTTLPGRFLGRYPGFGGFLGV